MDRGYEAQDTADQHRSVQTAKSDQSIEEPIQIQTIGSPKSVNLIKLTPMEFRVIEALNQPQNEGYPEGHGTNELAVLVYGSKALTHYSMGDEITSSVKTSLSRVLKQLFEKGCVRRCKPVYHYGWIKLYGASIGGYYGVIEKKLKVIWRQKDGSYVGEWRQFEFLPFGCHVWWMLTPEAKELLSLG
jgi:hypothetical protein